MSKNKFLETIKILDGKIYNISYHQKRYEEVLSSFSIIKFKNLLDYINAPKEGLYRCRLVYSASNIEDIEVSYHPYQKREITSLKIVYDATIEYSKKYLERDALNKLYKQKEDCDDILIVKNSYITDTSIANIAFFDGKLWHTPKNPLLRGTTRQRLLEESKIIASNIKVDMLKNYSKVALLNAMIDFDILADIKYKNEKDTSC